MSAKTANTGNGFIVSKQEIIDIFAVSERTLERLVQNGIITPLTEQKKGVVQKFDLRDAAKAYIAHVNAKANEHSALETERLNTELQMKKAKATITILEAKELQGKMHRAEDVARVTEDLVFTIRGMLLALPGRLAIDAANMSDPNEVSTLIRDEVHRIMDELSRYKYDLKKYEALVRKRLSWDTIGGEDGTDDD